LLIFLGVIQECKKECFSEHAHTVQYQ